MTCRNLRSIIKSEFVQSFNHSSNIVISRSRTLRSNSNNLPRLGFRISSVDNSIVDSVLSTLPELPFERHDSNAAPEIRHGDGFRVLELVLELGDLAVQHLSARNLLRLGGGPCADLGVTGSRRVVGLRFLAGEELHVALDSHLALKLLPEEGDGSPRVALDVLGLLAGAPVGVHHEASVVELLEQHGSGRDSARGQLGRGEIHGFGDGDLRVFGLLEPAVELLDGVFVDVGDVQGRLLVLVRRRGGDDFVEVHSLCGCAKELAGEAWYNKSHVVK